MPTTRFALVRHGQTDWNAQRRIQGSTDIPLNATGYAQATQAATRLLDGGWDGVVASPLVRASETARVIASELGLAAPLIVPGLVERSYGELEGLTKAQRAAKFPTEESRGGLEPRSEVAARVLAALRDLDRDHPGASLIVVTHGGVIGSVLRHITDGQHPRPGEYIPNGSHHVIALERPGLWEVREFHTQLGEPGFRPIP